MYSLGSWWGGKYIFSIPFFVFPIEPSVYPLYTLGLGPFLLIYLSSLCIKNKIKE